MTSKFSGSQRKWCRCGSEPPDIALHWSIPVKAVVTHMLVRRAMSVCMPTSCGFSKPSKKKGQCFDTHMVGANGYMMMLPIGGRDDDLAVVCRSIVCTSIKGLWLGQPQSRSRENGKSTLQAYLVGRDRFAMTRSGTQVMGFLQILRGIQLFLHPTIVSTDQSRLQGKGNLPLSSRRGSACAR